MTTLLPFQSQDFEQLIKWIDSKDLLIQFAGPLFTYPLTNQQLENYIGERNRLAYKIVLSADNTTIGHAEISFPDSNTAIFCRILVGDPAQRGKGIGGQIIQQLLQVAFAKPGIETIMLNVYDWNIAAIKCYEKAGFIINPAKKRQQQVNNKVWTSLNMVYVKGAT